MNENINTQPTAQTDTVARDFVISAMIVSVFANLAVFTTWLTAALA